MTAPFDEPDEDEWCQGCGAPTWGNSCPACGAIFEDEEEPDDMEPEAGTCASCLFWRCRTTVTMDGQMNALCDNELSPRFGTLTAGGETCRAQAEIGGRE